MMLPDKGTIGPKRHRQQCCFGVFPRQRAQEKFPGYTARSSILARCLSPPKSGRSTGLIVVKFSKSTRVVAFLSSTSSTTVNSWSVTEF
ncbi:hypothetical protein Q3G72_006837 [Acer saccharum]|nr:hypothetical protein Q3G72_006837 [Acer saccharum]